jgi:hypothetical protein
MRGAEERFRPLYFLPSPIVICFELTNTCADEAQWLSLAGPTLLYGGHCLLSLPKLFLQSPLPPEYLSLSFLLHSGGDLMYFSVSRGCAVLAALVSCFQRALVLSAADEARLPLTRSCATFLNDVRFRSLLSPSLALPLSPLTWMPGSAIARNLVLEAVSAAATTKCSSSDWSRIIRTLASVACDISLFDRRSWLCRNLNRMCCLVPCMLLLLAFRSLLSLIDVTASFWFTWTHAPCPPICSSCSRNAGRNSDLSTAPVTSSSCSCTTPFPPDLPSSCCALW